MDKIHEKRFPVIINKRPAIAINNSTISILSADNDIKNTYIKLNKISDTELNKIIVDNCDAIIELCGNDKIYELRYLITDLTNNKSLSMGIWFTLSQYCITRIIKNCIENNNMELFRTIIYRYYKQYDFVHTDIMNFIHKCNDPLLFLNILLENNIKIRSSDISYAISKNNIKFITYAGSLGYDIAESFDIVDFHHIDWELSSVLMLKTLMDNNVDILPKLKKLIISAINYYDSGMDLIEFLIESFPEHDINQYLGRCCSEHNNIALVYFLKRGANIHSINSMYILHTSIKIIKILINHDYPVPIKILNNLLIKHFKDDVDLTEVNYLLSNGAQMQCIFENEEIGKHRNNPNYANREIIYSNLELIITRGEFNKIKFLADNHLNLLKPEINRLFIISCANGRNDIALYLFDLGALFNDKALISAFYFNHFETIIMLMKLGMNLNLISMNDDLFVAAHMGFVAKGTPNEIYDKLIDDTFDNNDAIFRNDTYNYGISEHSDIIKLLISYDIPVKNIMAMITPYHNLYYDVKIIEYLICNGLNTNKRWGMAQVDGDSRTLLEGVIIFAKPDKMYLDIIELLLQNKCNKEIINENAIKTINNPVYEPIKTLLLKYGVCL